jgi:flavin reductase (DIM6/NTAB) family NADH-FMN oxidoreductase RutF
MLPDPDSFRRVMGHFVTGVSVVTTFRADEPERPYGITVNALTSVSLEPPLVMVAIGHGRRIEPHIRATGRYAVNILAADQQRLADCFAGAAVEPDREAFCGAEWVPGSTGLPLLRGAIAYLECTTVRVISVGDHDLHIGRVDRLATAPDHAPPLLYYRRRYVRIEQATETPPEGRP